MNQTQHNALANFIWGIADDILAVEEESEGLLESIIGSTTP